jgi:hypothetical protein
MCAGSISVSAAALNNVLDRSTHPRTDACEALDGRTKHRNSATSRCGAPIVASSQSNAHKVSRPFRRRIATFRGLKSL